MVVYKISMLQTIKSIQIKVTEVFNSQPKHGVLGSIYSSMNGFAPISILIDVDVNSTTDITVLYKELRSSNYKILPSVKEGQERGVKQMQIRKIKKKLLNAWSLPISV